MFVTRSVSMSCENVTMCTDSLYKPVLRFEFREEKHRWGSKSRHRMKTGKREERENRLSITGAKHTWRYVAELVAQDKLPKQTSRALPQRLDRMGRSTRPPETHGTQNTVNTHYVLCVSHRQPQTLTQTALVFPFFFLLSVHRSN